MNNTSMSPAVENFYRGYMIAVWQKPLPSLRPYQGSVCLQDGRTALHAPAYRFVEAAEVRDVVSIARRWIDQLP